MKWIIISLLFLTACSNKQNDITHRNIAYKPIDKSLLKDVKPYSTKPKPTLKDKIKQQQYEECMNRNKQINENQHIPDTILQDFLNELSCS